MGSPGFLRTDRVWVSHYMVRPFPHVKAWGGTAQITMQGHRGTFFSDCFQISGDVALSFSGLLD